MTTESSKTMVIDPHCHHMIENWVGDGFWEMLATQLSSHIFGDHKEQARDAKRAFWDGMFPKFTDPDGEKLIAKMDDCGIDVTFLVHNDFSLLFGKTAVPIIEQNRQVAALADRYPDRLKAFCCVDPRQPDALDILERCIKEFGMKGIGECHPDAGWSPTSPEAYRMYAKLQEWGIPVLEHTGLFFPPTRSRLNHPLLLDDVCCDFPELTVIAAHAGRLLWWRTAAHLARIHPNLYAELSGFQPVAFNQFPLFCQILREMIDTCGANKIIWATDDPVMNALGIKTKAYLEIMRSLPEKSADGIKFTEAEISAILGGNAQRLMKL